MPDISEVGPEILAAFGVALEGADSDDGSVLKTGALISVDTGTVFSKATVLEFLAGASPSLYITPDVSQFMYQLRNLTFASPTTTIRLDGVRIADGGDHDSDSTQARLLVTGNTDIVWANVISAGLPGTRGAIAIVNNGGGSFTVNIPTNQTVVVLLDAGVTNPGLGTGNGDVLLVEYCVVTTSLIRLTAFIGGSGAPMITSAGTITSASLGKIGTSHTVTGFAFTGSGTPAYQWYRSSSPISGATSAAYTPVAADDLTNLVRRTTVTGSSGSANANTPAQAITYPVCVVTNAGTIAAAANLGKVGQAHTVSGFAFTGTGTPSYQWEADGTPIAGATASGYTPTSAEGGKALTRVTTVTNSGGAVSGETAAQAITSTFAPAWVNPNGNPITYDGAAFGSDGTTLDFYIMLKRMTDNPAAFVRLHTLSSRRDINLNSSGRLRVILKDTTATPVVLVDWLSTSAIDVAGEWLIHVSASLSGTPTCVFERCERVAGVMQSWAAIPGAFTTGPTNGTLDHSRAGVAGPDMVIFGNDANPPVNIPNCDMAFCWISIGTPTVGTAMANGGVLNDPLTVGTPQILVRGPAANLVNDEGSANLTLVATGWTDTV